MSQHFRIPIFIEERARLDRPREAIRLGVPLPRGLLREADRLRIIDESGSNLPQQSRPLASWPDGTVKWLLVDVLVGIAARGRTTLWIAPADAVGEDHAASRPSLVLAERDGAYVIDTGTAVFELAGSRGPWLRAARIGDSDLLGSAGARIRLQGCSGSEYEAVIERTDVEERGPVRLSVVSGGHFATEGRRSPLLFKARTIFVAGSSCVRLELLVRNGQAASHPGGVWDLEDQGTLLFEDLSLVVVTAEPAHELQWYAERHEETRAEGPGEWSLYQDSSGGENWDSDNHIDGSGRSSVRFRGYRVNCQDVTGQKLVAEGDRATPCLRILTSGGSIAATALGFWENFPKALRWKDGALSLGLFPGECQAPFALQGGEQKRHTLAVEFLPPNGASALPAIQQPLAAWVDPSWAEDSRALGPFVAAERDPNEKYLRYIAAIVEGPESFEAKRERIDEYGWRHFGDLYADHEAIHHVGPRPLVSHYNNQYDFVYGALVHFLRSGDSRWRRLADPAAQHTIDIDIYHTDDDRAAFNHGLFWHTDHYKPAATCTHRTYSRHNGRGRSYGGGPSNEHNYTSGLLLYFYLTGDPEAASAVRGLADWVIAMDDGSRSILGVIDPSPTGLGSKTVDNSYHKPGRGAGNSINALLDAYQLTGNRRYADYAETLIRRCIHPADDLDALHLDEPEHRWSYLVFLQVLGKYLHRKLQAGETDYMFHYARASLLHYARWMLSHETPYKEVLHKVELPTETWPAHDVRKCHILHLAAEFSPPSERDRYHDRADFFFHRSIEDVLSFKTAFLTRPLVILCVYGHVHAYYQARRGQGVEVEEGPDSFGQPEEFIPQRQRWRAALPARIHLAIAQLLRTAAERVDLFGRKSTPSRL